MEGKRKFSLINSFFYATRVAFISEIFFPRLDILLKLVHLIYNIDLTMTKKYSTSPIFQEIWKPP